MIGPGTATVRITVIDPPAIELTAATPVVSAPIPAPILVTAPIPVPAQAKPGQFAVQVGVFADRRNAERIRSLMEQRYGSASIVARESQPPQWRVLVGREQTQEGAESLASRIRSDPEGSAAAFVVRIFVDKEIPDSL
jgi:cell division protein FtsN